MRFNYDVELKSLINFKYNHQHCKKCGRPLSDESKTNNLELYYCSICNTTKIIRYEDNKSIIEELPNLKEEAHAV